PTGQSYSHSRQGRDDSFLPVMGNRSDELAIHGRIVAVWAYGSGSATLVRLMTVQAAGGFCAWRIPTGLTRRRHASSGR
ncbi:MAG: hypothetical protein OXC91_11730, partial [Rhodobacteraceae bacterium]|nr:hypothetical protein [Paracoccaceae bacterium]